MTSEEQILARRRAAQLLRRYLTPEQMEDWRKRRRFWVRGGVSGRMYLLRYKRQLNISEYNRRGLKVLVWCLAVGYGLPIADMLLAQKLMLEQKEEEFRYLSNSWSRNSWESRFGPWEDAGMTKEWWEHAERASQPPPGGGCAAGTIG